MSSCAAAENSRKLTAVPGREWNWRPGNIEMDSQESLLSLESLLGVLAARVAGTAYLADASVAAACAAELAAVEDNLQM